MLSHKSIAGLTLTMCTFFIAIGVTTSSGAQDFSTEQYRVDFMPWANRKLGFRTTDGRWIGYSAGGVKLEMLIDGNAYRAAMTPDGIDVTRLLSNMNPRQGSDGHTYFSMKIMQSVTLEDGRVIDASTDTQSNEVLLDVNDFYITKTLQPVDSSTSQPDAPPPQTTAVENFNNTLSQTGVTAPTRPSNTAADSVAAPPSDADDDDEADDIDTGNDGPGVGMGSPFPQRFLSSPLCSNGGRNVPTSGWGKRGTPDRNGKCHARNGKKMSCFHVGMDIGARMGTPVLAAAYGCFKVPGRAEKSRGTPINGNDLKTLRGYGNTLILDHGNGLSTQYSHLSRVSPRAQWKMCVQRGEVIGYTGNTGQSTGPHLHFGVLKNGKPIPVQAQLLKTTGAFFNPSCRAVPRYPDLDQQMRTALWGGRSNRTSGAGSSSLR